MTCNSGHVCFGVAATTLGWEPPLAATLDLGSGAGLLARLTLAMQLAQGLSTQVSQPIYTPD